MRKAIPKEKKKEEISNKMGSGAGNSAKSQQTSGLP